MDLPYVPSDVSDEEDQEYGDSDDSSSEEYEIVEDISRCEILSPESMFNTLRLFKWTAFADYCAYPEQLAAGEAMQRLWHNNTTSRTCGCESMSHQHLSE